MFKCAAWRQGSRRPAVLEGSLGEATCSAPPATGFGSCGDLWDLGWGSEVSMWVRGLRVGNEQDEINTSEKNSSCNTLTEQSLIVFGGLGSSLPFIHILNYFILKLKATTPGGCRCPQSDKALHYENYFQNDPWQILFCPPVSCMKTL